MRRSTSGDVRGRAAPLIYQHAVARGDVAEVIRQWEQPDIVGPLFPLVAGIIRAIHGASLSWMRAVEQIFYVITTVATYAVARRLVTRRWATLTALMVAVLPGVLRASRYFLPAAPCAAAFTATVATQLRAGSFANVRLPSIGGVARLDEPHPHDGARSHPALLVAAIVRALHGHRRRQLVNLGAGIAVAGLIAGSWYVLSWDTVYRYLTEYGPPPHHGLDRARPTDEPVVDTARPAWWVTLPAPFHPAC